MTLRCRWVGERRALALLVLGFYTTMFLLVALAQGGAWARCFGALALTYGLAFFAVASEWFWGRWFGQGLATSGMTMAALGLLTSGWNGPLAIWGLLHAAVYLPLLGPDMAELYEGQAGWRKRYQLDELSVDRIKRSVQAAAAALPTLIFYTLAPRQADGTLSMVFWGGVLGLALWGTAGLLRLRTWGVFLLAGTGALVLGQMMLGGIAGELAAGHHELAFFCDAGLMPAIRASGVAQLPRLSAWVPGLIAAGALLLAATPFLMPAYRALRGRET